MKNLSFVSSFLFIMMLISFVVYPTAVPMLGAFSLIFSLALSTYTIIHKHKRTEHARLKILKDVGVMVFTLVAVIFLGGIAATLANYQASIRWGAATGLVSALVASFGMGYLVRVGMVKLSG